MKKKTRTIIFIIFVVLFILAAPSVIFYSQGFRFNFEEKRIVQTGGLYFRVLPRSAEIYLNGKLKAKTSMITNSALIENLLPKTYQIEIKKQGYHAWQKNLEVREIQVTEAKNIILIPEELNFAIVNQPPSEIISQTTFSATSSDKKKVVESNDYEIWILFPESQGDPFQEEAGKRIFLTRFSEKIGHIFWLTNDYLVFSVGDKIKIAEIDDRDRLNVVDLAEFENPEIFWDQQNKKLYILSQEGFFLLENLLP